MFLRENRWRDVIRGESRSRSVPEDLSKCKELLLRLQAGDRLEFGKYDLCNRADFRKPFVHAPIVWRVLAREGDKLLIVSEHCLDIMWFDRSEQSFKVPDCVSWAQSAIRKTLNSTCLNAWFTKAEQRLIQKTALPPESNSLSHIRDTETTEDRLFLLSFAEVVRYMYKAELSGDWSEWGNDRSAGGADCGSAVALLLFTKRKSTNKEEVEFFAEPVTWWLRTPGSEENWRMAVETDGSPSMEGYSADRGEISVRPAMWLDLGKLSLLTADGGNKPE